jgi:hypothetical protein
MSYTEAGSPERMIINGGAVTSYLIRGRSAMESDIEAGSLRRGSALDRVREWFRLGGRAREVKSTDGDGLV